MKRFIASTLLLTAATVFSGHKAYDTGVRQPIPLSALSRRTETDNELPSVLDHYAPRPDGTLIVKQYRNHTTGYEARSK